jgi:hypothetical protein
LTAERGTFADEGFFAAFFALFAFFAAIRGVPSRRADFRRIVKGL